MSPRDNAPETLTRCFLLLFLVGVCSRGYGYYNQQLIHEPRVWIEVIAGRANAPEQYRVGVVRSADWIARHVRWGSHDLRLSQAFGLLDLLGALTATLLLYRVLEHSAVYRRSGTPMRWFASAAFAALVVYAVDWTLWYQKVGTLPTAGLVAMMVWLWSPRATTDRRKQALIASAIMLLVLVQSFVRADIALALCLGVLAASALRLGGPLSLTRGAAMATGALGASIAVAVQLYLIKALYPQATYGSVPAFMLRYDWQRPTMWAATAICLAPLAWTTAETLRQRRQGEGAPEGLGAALLLSAWAYAALWICLGRLDEVRIYLPMALATAPLTVQTAMRRLARDPVGAGTI